MKKKEKEAAASLISPIMFLYIQGSIDKCIIHKEERDTFHYSDHIHGIGFGGGAGIERQEAIIASIGCNKSGYSSHAYDLAVLSFQHS